MPLSAYLGASQWFKRLLGRWAWPWRRRGGSHSRWRSSSLGKERREERAPGRQLMNGNFKRMMICPLLQEWSSTSQSSSSAFWGSPLSYKIWSLGVSLPDWVSFALSSCDMTECRKAGFIYGWLTQAQLSVWVGKKDDATLGIRALKRRSCRNECNTLWTLVLGPWFPNLDSFQKAEDKMSSEGFGKLLSVNQQLSKKDKWGWSSCITSEIASIESRLYFSWAF